MGRLDGVEARDRFAGRLPEVLSALTTHLDDCEDNHCEYDGDAKRTDERNPETSTRPGRASIRFRDSSVTLLTLLFLQNLSGGLAHPYAPSGDLLARHQRLSLTLY